MSKEKKSTCILVVDDDKEMRELIADYLDDNGYKVLCAQNGIDALNNYLPNYKIDLVLSDINMPQMKGFELLKEVREKYPQIKRVLITAYSVEDYLELALKHDVGNILVKSTPFNFKELITVLNNLLTGDIFGLYKYFDSPVFKKEFIISKGNCLDSYANEIIKNIPQYDKIKKIELVLIELLTNAIFYGIRGEKSDNKESWNYDFELSKEDSIIASLMYDEEKFGISIMDKGGRLKKTDVLFWVNRQVTRDENGLPIGVYDTHGRGFYITREYIDRLIINIKPQKRTEIILINYFSKIQSLGREYKPLYINEI